MALDSSGNIYIADSSDNRIREVTIASGNISSVAGNGTPGYTGDGAAATSAEINGPNGAALDSSGNIYISDTGNHRIRVVNPGTGSISTLAGNGTQGVTGNGGPATSAALSYPNQIAVDSLGNVYLADSTAQQVRQVQVNTTFPTTAVTSSSAVQNVFLQTTAAETLTSFTAPQSQGSKQEYSIGTITGCTVNGSTSNPSGTICTLPITFTPAYPGPRNVPLTAVTGTGNVGFGLTAIGAGPLAVLIPGIISTVAGNGTAGYTGNGAAATSAKLNSPRRALADNSGNLYIADFANSVIRKVTVGTGLISTIAGNGTPGYSGDGSQATSGQLNNPDGLGIDSAGNIYIADKNSQRIRKVTTATGVLTTVAGNGTSGYSGDGGLAVSAAIKTPSSNIAFDSAGNFYFADSGNNLIREVNLVTGLIGTVAGNGTAGYSGDGGAATAAQLNDPIGVALDAYNNIYIADYGNARIRKMSALTGIITTLAGNGTLGYSGDGGAATSAELSLPSSVAVDAAGNVYIADSGNTRIRAVVAGTGIISTIAGNGTKGYTGDNGAATSAELNTPYDISLDSQGNLCIADKGSNVVREVNIAASSAAYPTATPVATLDGADDPEAITVANIGNASLTISVPSSGNNPSVSAYFQLDNATTCPQLNTASSPGTLAAGQVCNYAVDFSPTVAGSVSGSVIVTDNSLGATAATQTINLTATATKGTPPISWSNPAAITYGAALSSTQLNAGSSLAGTFVYSPSSGTVLSAGSQTLSVTFNPTDTTNYNSGTGNVTLTVNPAAPTITFTVSNQTYGVSPFTVSATSNSAGVITYSVVSGPATISGSTVTITGVGTVVLQASEAANGNYTAGTQNASFTVSPAAPTITFTVSNQTYGVSPFAVSATSNSAGAITYSVVSGPATISGSTVTITGVGTVALQAAQAANGNYTAGTQNASFTVSAAAPAITFTVSNQTYGVSPFTVSATSNSAGVITYTVVSGPATISGSTVTITGAGTVVLQAAQAANGNYAAATQNASFTVSVAAQTITFPNPGTQNFGVAPITLTATATSNLTVSYSVTSGPAFVVGSSLTVTGAGCGNNTGQSGGQCKLHGCNLGQRYLYREPRNPDGNYERQRLLLRARFADHDSHRCVQPEIALIEIFGQRRSRSGGPATVRRPTSGFPGPL